ncbi:hypothetical protein MLD38_007678 [Melastoma candidum]|uniref:Uncharacterized protein n=1 Tax=Melastoma candidum TaxID=119954 RepID=A0ACB9RVM3_9MYRT|nr:hypothetical protein MLD38_007678 [Melastoma candidum]
MALVLVRISLRYYYLVVSTNLEPKLLVLMAASNDDDTDCSSCNAKRAESSNTSQAPFPYVKPAFASFPGYSFIFSSIMRINLVLLLPRLLPRRAGAHQFLTLIIKLEAPHINLWDDPSRCGAACGPWRVHFHVDKFVLLYLLEEDLRHHILIRIRGFLGDQNRVSLICWFRDCLFVSGIRDRWIQVDGYRDKLARHPGVGTARRVNPLPGIEVVHVEHTFWIIVFPDELLMEDLLVKLTLTQLNKAAIRRQKLPVFYVHSPVPRICALSLFSFISGEERF